MDRQDPLASLLCLTQAALSICRKFWLADSGASGLSFLAVPVDTTWVVWFNLASSLTGRMATDTLCTFVLLCIATRHIRVHHFHPRTGVTEERVPLCPSSTSSRGHLVQMQFPQLACGHGAKSKDPTVKWAAGSWLTAEIRAGLCLCCLKDCAVRLGGSALPCPEHHHLLQVLAVLHCPQHLEPWHLLRISLAQQVHVEMPEVNNVCTCPQMQWVCTEVNSSSHGVVVQNFAW